MKPDLVVRKLVAVRVALLIGAILATVGLSPVYADQAGIPGQLAALQQAVQILQQQVAAQNTAIAQLTAVVNSESAPRMPVRFDLSNGLLSYTVPDANYLVIETVSAQIQCKQGTTGNVHLSVSSPSGSPNLEIYVSIQPSYVVGGGPAVFSGAPELRVVLLAGEIVNAVPACDAGTANLYSAYVLVFGYLVPTSSPSLAP